MVGSKLFLIFLLVIEYCGCANILYVIPFTSKSHYIMLRPIGLELARRGHNVTVITAFREADHPPNYHEVIVDDKEIWDVTGGKRPNVFTMVEISAEDFHDKILWGGGYGFTEVALNSTEVKKFLARDHKFDLVICEQFFQEALYILAHKYQAPLALVTTFGNCMRHNIVIRNPLQLATVTAEFLDLKEPESFVGRVRNWYFTVYEYLWWKYWFLPKNEELVKKYVPNLKEPVPSLFEMQRNASLILINSHFSFDPPTAYLPNVVEVGGLHLSRSDGHLPMDLQKILDDSKHGVVYVNFGSNVRSSELPLEKKNAFLNVFKQLKQTVLWKWEDENFENKPDNLVIRKWMPQKEILAHPNIKVFLSHGGLIGTQEAIFNGVPIIGIPIYADQYNNLLQAQDIGFGKILPYHDINESTLRHLVNDVINNDYYRNKAKEVSRRFKDRPLSALDTAMFWIEYVIRNRGAEFMKNPARDLNWFAYTMFDVYAFVFVCAAVVIYIVIKLISALLQFLGSNEDLGKKKKN
ncbi:UDP-glycosyltransferase UGT5-like [Pectinophora gossypiella]|nr:UDP-glycosyltransferase UGT5-like [Pectinophora gossypiella]